MEESNQGIAGQICRDLNLASGDYEYLAAQLERAQEVERERCCRDMCGLCRDGKEVVLSKIGNGYYFHRTISGTQPCDAAPIRRRAAK